MLRALATRGASLRGPLLSRAVSHDALLFDTSRSEQPLAGMVPSVACDAWVAPNASLVGAVFVDNQVSVGFGAVLRGDLAPIHIQSQTSVGDRVVIGTAGSVPTGLSAAVSVGRNCTLGAGSLLRSAVLEADVILGLKCTLLEGSIVERGSILLDGSLLPPGRRVPAGQVWGGAPVHFVRAVSYGEAAEIVALSEELADLGQRHANNQLPEQDLSVADEVAARRAALAKALTAPA